MKLDVWSILIIITLAQGLFLLSVILFSKKRRSKKGTIYLIATLIVLFWFLSEFLFIRQTIKIPFNIFYGTRYGSWLLLGPLTYLFTQAITNDKKPGFSKKDSLHFLPFIVLTLLIPLLFGNFLNHRQVHYGMLSVFDHREKIIGPLQYLYSVVFVLQFLHLGYYLIHNLVLIKKYKYALRQSYSYVENHIKWLERFNLVLLFILLSTGVFLYILLVTDIYRRPLDYIYVIPTGILFYFISYYIINVNWQSIDRKPLKYAGSSFNQDDMKIYTERLHHLMVEEKVYLNNKIRLKDLSERINLSNHHSSQLINQQFNLSFFDFINKYRVSEAKKLISEHPDYTLLQIAFEAGFNNKTSFVNAFKKFENTTPSNFRKSLREA